jgi:hypothetical protein
MDDGTSSLCGTGTTLAMGHVAAARATLAGNATSSLGPPPTPYVVVLHPYAILDLVDILTPVLPATDYPFGTTGEMTEDVLRNYWRGQLFGMNVFEDGNIAVDATPDAKGGCFSQGNSIVFVVADEWDVNPEDDFSLRATELNCVGEYGDGEYHANWIVELISDATAPA